MAVKFSQFNQETVAANVTRLVGYTATGDLNIQIPPANLDTTYTFATAQDGNNVDLTLTGTKTGTANTTEVLQFTASNAIALTAGTDELTIASTAYALSATDNADPAQNTPVVLTGTGGGDSGTDTLNIIGSGTVGVTSSSGTITITGSSGSTGVTSFTNTNGTFISAATANAAATGAVTTGIIDLSATGTPSASNFLRGDNTWAIPAGAYTDWKLEGDQGTQQAIADGNVTTFKENTTVTVNSVQVGGGVVTTAANTDNLLLDQTSEMTVTVVNPGSGNLLYIDGDYQPIINLTQGFTYEFNQDAATNSGHPLEIGEVLDGATPYATGIQYYGSASANTLTAVTQADYVTNTATYSGGSGTARVRLRITQSTPALYYYCSIHSGMGGSLVALNDRYTGLSALGSGSTFALNFATATTFTATANANATFNFSNAVQGQVVDLIVSGVYTLEFAETGSTFNRVGSVEYDSTTNNIIQIICTDDAPGAKVYHYSVATFQSDTTPG